MERELLDTNHGFATLVAGLIVILCLHLILNIVKMALENYKKKSEISEQALAGLSKVENRLTTIERDMNEILKFRNDFNRLFSAVKALAGKDWPRVRKQMLEDNLGHKE